MPSIIDDDQLKKKCQVFTPTDIVDYMLDMAIYNDGLYGKSFLENSCGDGQILVRIVDRYISDCKLHGLHTDLIKSGLENDIVAYDIDPQMVACTQQKLDALALQNGFTSVKWDIRNADFLSDDSQKKYDYIFGNPPYISYADLPAESRKYLRQNFSSCKKGKFDYSYAFVEKSYNVLSQGGQLVYLVPCYIIKNVYATDIRQMIKNDLRAVIEFQGKRIFRQALVTPTIIHVEKDSQLPALQHSIYGKDTVVSISKNLIGDKWTFGKQPSNPGTRLGDKYSVSSSIATLCNDAFVLKGGHMNDMHYVIGEYRIERSILRPATSPKTYKIYDLEEYIIFPYYFDEGNILHRYSEEEMNIYFPGCINYLTSFREKLDARCADKSAAWYEYGRSQAIRHMNQRKIMISSIISAQTKAYLLDEECIPYSGIYIFPKGNASLDDLLNIINTAEFRAYTAEIGVSVSGTSKRITPHDIEEYRF